MSAPVAQPVPESRMPLRVSRMLPMFALLTLHASRCMALVAERQCLGWWLLPRVLREAQCCSVWELQPVLPDERCSCTASITLSLHALPFRPS